MVIGAVRADESHEASRTDTSVTHMLGAEATSDTLVVNGLEVEDVIDVEAGIEALIQLVLNP